MLCILHLCAAFLLLLSGCAGFGAYHPPPPPESERVRVAVANFGMGVAIRKVSSIKTVPEKLSEQDEGALLTEAIVHIKGDARRLLHQRLMTAEAFALISEEEVESAACDVRGDMNSSRQAEALKCLRTRLGVDIIVQGTVLDYGKVRWTWMAAGMLSDMT